ncbi:hypothetical protein NPIL_567881 [Nephila pilipes]|uniref:Uncharacterized protein n=1 Tax=Nephila pilipes TaxID=299642 RepID=A0A8X6UJP6_NEPPI|nr:hypothetical protein NPIL_567881 [Nephila pilipes]
MQRPSSASTFQNSLDPPLRLNSRPTRCSTQVVSITRLTDCSHHSCAVLPQNVGAIVSHFHTNRRGPPPTPKLPLQPAISALCSAPVETQGHLVSCPQEQKAHLTPCASLAGQFNNFTRAHGS